MSVLETIVRSYRRIAWKCPIKTNGSYICREKSKKRKDCPDRGTILEYGGIVHKYPVRWECLLYEDNSR